MWVLNAFLIRAKQMDVESTGKEDDSLYCNIQKDVRAVAQLAATDGAALNFP